VKPVSVAESTEDVLVILLKIHIQLLGLLRVVKDLIYLLMIVVVVIEFLPLIHLVLVIERLFKQCAVPLPGLLVKLAVDLFELFPHLSEGLVGATGR
jgi:hypothetical protein